MPRCSKSWIPLILAAVLQLALVEPAASRDGFTFHIVPAQGSPGCTVAPGYGHTTTRVTELSTPTGPFYHAFVIACLDDFETVPPRPQHGIGGVEFGIQYAGGYSPSGGLSPLCVFDWASCGDLQFPSTGWPGPGGGNVVTWQNTRCVATPRQSSVRIAVVGWFYLGAYASASMNITRRPVSGKAQLADCTGAEYDVTQGVGTLTGLGIAGFGPISFGYDGCITGTPVERSSWSAIKARPFRP